jgi:hypothetical protein
MIGMLPIAAARMAVIASQSTIFCFAKDGLRSTLSRVMQLIAVGYAIADSQNPMSVM